MQISKILGLDDERFCHVMVTTKMFGIVNVLGHAAELHYEKFLHEQDIQFDKGANDEHYDYVVNNFKDQVKRFETAYTTAQELSANLTKTHGNRSATTGGSYYFRNNFDRLVIQDLDHTFSIINTNEIPANKKYPDQLPGRYKFRRKKKFTPFQNDLLDALKQKNENFVPAMKNLRTKYNHKNYIQTWEAISGLTLEETDSLFSKENFRLITAAKGFVAEEHFNKFLDQNNIPYAHSKAMYSKADHLVNGKRFQVKTTYPRSTDATHWAFKTHKSHGHGQGELYKNDAFDVAAVFVGYDYTTSNDNYTPSSVKTEFIFIPITEINEHPKYPGHLKRVTRVLKSDYKINDLIIF